MEGDVLGYDPGGNDAHGVARLTVNDGKIAACVTDTRPDAEAVIDWFTSGGKPLGVGIDTLTVWSTGKSGWRPADRWLRERYPKDQASVVSPNTLRGAMSLNGMMVMLALREKWPDLRVTETHPKVLYHALTGREHDWSVSSRDMRCWLRQKFGCEVCPCQGNMSGVNCRGKMSAPQ